jgi:hypothetical protein
VRFENGQSLQAARLTSNTFGPTLQDSFLVAVATHRDYPPLVSSRPDEGTPGIRESGDTDGRVSDKLPMPKQTQQICDLLQALEG